jgi:[ribosomal protein S5]-alanine N-acetyltransferase
MEKMPYREELDMRVVPATDYDVVSTDWRSGLPALAGQMVTLRELRASDAASLFALLTTEEVSRFISPPPTSVEGFEKFIAWAHRQRKAGQYLCYAVTVKGYDTAIGIFQVRDLHSGLDTAEWGFAIGSRFWGTGVFEDAASLVLEFAFDTLGVRRLEARAAVQNGRGHGALLKMGAVQEAILRQSFAKNGRHLDQALFTILEKDWRPATNVRKEVPQTRIH